LLALADVAPVLIDDISIYPDVPTARPMTILAVSLWARDPVLQLRIGINVVSVYAATLDTLEDSATAIDGVPGFRERYAANAGAAAVIFRRLTFDVHDAGVFACHLKYPPIG
jgi:hypothetical protein